MAAVDLSGIDIVYSDDPRPKSPPRKSAPTSSRKTPNGIKTEIREEVEAFIALMAVPIVMRDPTCGGSLMQQREAIADALAEIAMTNDTMLRLLQSGGTAMLWLKLVTAVSPVAVTVYHHHVVREVESDEFGDGSVE